eukprot:TRINITY_DN65265_c0_g1_i1.p1 TRINITY_DN65265_c0_g1~~TRINITY_DN65265_c0_g1_i1.p1  ORF type:complete len:676 (+),score=151.52 TRINITY_DN65265_c0_g1_i1:56-2083(+)
MAPTPEQEQGAAVLCGVSEANGRTRMQKRCPTWPELLQAKLAAKGGGNGLASPSLASLAASSSSPDCAALWTPTAIRAMGRVESSSDICDNVDVAIARVHYQQLLSDEERESAMASSLRPIRCTSLDGFRPKLTTTRYATVDSLSMVFNYSDASHLLMTPFTPQRQVQLLQRTSLDEPLLQADENHMPPLPETERKRFCSLISAVSAEDEISATWEATWDFAKEGVGRLPSAEPDLLRNISGMSRTSVDRHGSKGGHAIKAGMTKFQAAGTIANMLIGVGMLSMPYGLKAAGSLLGTSILCAVALLLTYTARLIGRALTLSWRTLEEQGVPPEHHDFAALAEVAFGQSGRTVIALVFIAELWSAFEAFLILFADNLAILCGLHKAAGIAVCTAGSFALLFVSPRMLSLVSMVSLVSMGLAFWALLASGLALPDGPELAASGEAWEADDLARPAGAFTTIGLALFSFAGHPAMPSVYCGMQDPERDFAAAASLAMGIAGFFYIGTAVCGYWFFGDCIDQVFTSNIGKDVTGEAIPHLAWLGSLTAVGFVVKIQGSAPLILAPFIAVLERLAGLHNLQASSNGASSGGTWRRLVLLSSLAIASFVFAIVFADEIALFSALTGNILIMATSVVFPALAYLRIAAEEVGPWERRLILLLAGAGTLFAMGGTVHAVRERL